MSNQVRRKLKLYLIGWYPSNYYKDFVKYKDQNRFFIKNKTELDKLDTFTNVTDKMYKDSSNFNIYCINRVNYSRIFFNSILSDLQMYPSKSILFFPKCDEILFSKEEIKDIKIAMLLRKTKESPLATNVVDLTNLLFELRANMQYWNPHTEDGTKYFHFENSTDWEYV